MGKFKRVLPPDTDIGEFLLSLEPKARAKAVALLGLEEADAYDRDWGSWVHRGQNAPAGDWSTWVVMGGRGFGKTRAGSEWVNRLITQAQSGPAIRIALVAATLAEGRSVMVEGKSGLLAVAEPWVDEWFPARGILRFKGGSEARLFSGATPSTLRGPEHDYAWCDELAKWRKAQECWDMLRLGLRLGETPRALVTTTPRPGPVLTGILAEPKTILTGGPTKRNPHNAPAFTEHVYARYAGTRLARQELEGELLSDAPGALWTVELLERCRGEADRSAAMVRVVIAVDPPSGDGTCGIVACGSDAAGRAHVLADHSVTARSPEGWARVVAEAARAWAELHPAARVSAVAETNQGGNMVGSIIAAADPRLKVAPANAVVGKSDRAAPVAMRFETGEVTLGGRFPELEAQLCGMIAGGGYEGPGRSPDRADAMVWGLTELMLKPERAPPRVRAL
ncbi:MAG TPA: terminase family protein [Allosphingosinicella sp.]